MPETEQRELAKMYEDKGLSSETRGPGRPASSPTTTPCGAHADIEFGIDPDDLTNPWHAAFASMIAFTARRPAAAAHVTLVPAEVRILVTVLARRRRARPHRIGERPDRLQPAPPARSCATSPAACWPWA